LYKDANTGTTEREKHSAHKKSIFRELLMFGSAFLMAGENTLEASDMGERLEWGARCRAFLGVSTPLLFDCISGGGAEAF